MIKKLFNQLCLAITISLALSIFPMETHAKSFNQSSNQEEKTLKKQSGNQENQTIYSDENIKINFIEISGIGLRYAVNFKVENISDKHLYVWIDGMSINGSLIKTGYHTTVIKAQSGTTFRIDVDKGDAVNIPKSQVRDINIKFEIFGYDDSSIDYSTNNISLLLPPAPPYSEPHVHSCIMFNVQEATCETPGIIKFICEYCEYTWLEETKPNGHRLNHTIMKGPTALETGYIKKICTVCNKVVEEETIPKLKASVKISKSKLTLKKGKTYTLKIKKFTFGDKIKNWTSSKTKIASVNKKTGKIKALKKGKTKITLQMKSGCKATCTVTVK